jgi:hypothetical protein
MMDGASRNRTPPMRRQVVFAACDQRVLRGGNNLTTDGEEDQAQVELYCSKRNSLAMSTMETSSGAANDLTRSGHSSADSHAAGRIGVS